MAIDPIKIDGLAEFTRNLKKLDKDLPKAVRLAANEAADLIVTQARPRVPSGPGRGGHAKSSVKAKSTRTAARVSGGGKKFPYYAWLDFGGRVGRNRSVRRPFLKEGRYIWKAFADNRGKVEETLAEALVEVARSAGVEVDS